MDVLDYFASKVEPPGIVVALCSTQRRGGEKDSQLSRLIHSTCCLPAYWLHAQTVESRSSCSVENTFLLGHCKIVGECRATEKKETQLAGASYLGKKTLIAAMMMETVSRAAKAIGD